MLAKNSGFSTQNKKHLKITLDCNGFEENVGFRHVGKTSGVAKGCDKNVLT